MYELQAGGFGDCLGKTLLLILSITIPTMNQIPILGSSPAWLTDLHPI